MTEPRPTYTRAEMEAILARALERQEAQKEGVAHDDLVAAAAEVGIPREEVEAAARELAQKKAAAPVELPAAQSDRTRALRRLVPSLLSWAAFSVFFYALAARTGATWWVWAVGGWGLALVFRAIRILAGGQEHRESRRERRRRRREERLRDFEEKVEIGAGALLRVIEEARRVKERAGERAQAVEKRPARVRVDGNERGRDGEGEDVDEEREEGRRQRH